MPPRRASIGRLVDTVSDGDVTADVRLTCAGPQDVRVRGRERERPDRRDLHVVEDRLPMDPTVDSLEDAAGSRASVRDIEVARLANHGTHTVSFRADVPVVQLGEDVGRHAGLSDGGSGRRETQEDNSTER